MTSRRSFFKRCFLAATTVAVAPMVLRALPAAAPALDLQDLFSQAYKVARARGNSQTIDIYTDRETADRFKKSMARYSHYQSRREIRLARRQERLAA